MECIFLYSRQIFFDGMIKRCFYSLIDTVLDFIDILAVRAELDTAA